MSERKVLSHSPLGKPLLSTVTVLRKDYYISATDIELFYINLNYRDTA